MPADIIEHLGQHAERQRLLHRVPTAKTHLKPRRVGQATPAPEHGRLPQPRLPGNEQRAAPPGADRADQPGDGLCHAVALQQPATARHHTLAPTNPVSKPDSITRNPP